MSHATNNQNSEKKKSTSSLEKGLIASEIRYRRLFESAKDGILILDGETGMIVDVNPFLINLLGFSNENFMQKAVWEIGFFNDIVQNKDKFLELQQKEYVRYKDLPLETADGRKIHIEFVSNVYLVDKKKVIQCNIRDITERKLAEDALLENEIKYRVFFDNSMDAILLTSPDGKIQSANQAACSMFGYSEDELIKLGSSGIADATDPRLSVMLAERKLKGKTLGELTFNRKDGTHFLAEISSAVFKDNEGNDRTSMIIRDITGRKKLESNLSTAAEIAKLGYWEFDVKSGNFIFDDQYYRLIHGSSTEKQGGNIMSAEEFVRRLVHPDDSKIIGTNLQEAISSIDPEYFGQAEARVFRDNGDIANLIVQFKVLKDQFGNINTVYGISQDITERKLAEENISSLAKFPSENPDPVLRISRDGRLLFANEASYSFFTWKLELEKPAPAVFQNIINDVFKQLKFEEIEFENNNRIFSVHAVPILESNYTNLYILDITKRKLAEKKLMESEFRFKQVSENAQELIWEVDKNGLYTYSSPIIKGLLGYEPEEIIGKKHFYDLFDQENRQELKQAALGIFARKENFKDFVNINRHKDGRKIILSTSAIPILDDLGNLIGYRGVDIDITEHKLNEEEIHKSEYRYRNLFENIGIAIWEEDFSDVRNYIDKLKKTGINDFRLYFDKRADEVFKCASLVKILDVNMEVLNVVKAKSKEEVIKSLPAFFIEGSFNALKEELIALAEGKMRIDGEIPIKILNGEIRQIFFQLTIVPGYEDTWAKGLFSFIDITKRNLDEKEITMLAHSLKSVNECVSITDLEDKIIFINESFLKTYGYLENELIGENINIVRSQNNTAKLVEKILPDTLKEGWKGELLNKRKDGYEFPIYLSTTIINDKNGKPLGLIGVASDITEQKRIENELIKAKEKAEATEIQLLSILENSPTGFAINTISTGKVRYVNKTFSNIYHIPHEICQNVESFFEYVYGDQMALGNKILDDSKSGDPERMKWDIIPVTDKTTKKVHFVSAANIILKDQDLMISSVWDITSQVENEEKLVAALNKATESDRLKSAFLANMSHEIRTPMNGILGFAGLLKEPGLTGEKQQEYIKIIEKSGARMLNIISEIMDISRIESGQMEVIYKETNINKLIESTFNLLKLDADFKRINLSFKNSLPAKETIIKTDSEKLYSILTNLVKNAVKYTDKGSVEFGFKNLGNYLEFYVKDTGIGIPSEKQEVIFERFIQADIADLKARQGAGLGLSIAKAFVEMLGGKIWVESEEGLGSTFYFTLPFDHEPEEPDSVSQVVPPEGAINKIDNLKILIAEDDETSEMLISITISEFSKEIIKARTGSEAVEICRSNPDIDLILMDIRMPDLNGYKATRQIRQFNKDVIIIAQTAFGLVGDREKAIKSGCNDYISKPIAKDKLLTLIQKYFKK